MTQCFKCCLTPWSFPFVTISHSVTGEAFFEFLQQPSERNLPLFLLKNVCCWILQFSRMSFSFPLMPDFAFRYASPGIILLKWTYMKCYVIICYSFESIIPFNHKFYWVPTRWLAVTPVPYTTTANIYWTFIMWQALFWQFYVNYPIHYFQELCEVDSIIPFYRWGNSCKGRLNHLSQVTQLASSRSEI